MKLQICKFVSKPVVAGQFCAWAIQSTLPFEFVKGWQLKNLLQSVGWGTSILPVCGISPPEDASLHKDLPIGSPEIEWNWYYDLLTVRWVKNLTKIKKKHGKKLQWH